jgi:FtsZ-binding cell division protein ZapB
VNTYYSSKVYNQILDDIEQFYSLWKPLENSISIDIETVNITDKEVLKLTEKNARLEKRIDILTNEKIELKEKQEKLEILVQRLWNEIITGEEASFIDILKPKKN